VASTSRSHARAYAVRRRPPARAATGVGGLLGGGHARTTS